jgi:WD40 repeat protein
LWDVAEKRLITSVAGHSHRTHAVRFSPDGQRLATGSMDWKVKLWEVPTLQELKSFTEHVEFVLAVGFSPDGRFLASGGGDFNVNRAALIRLRRMSPQRVPNSDTL